MYEKPQLSMSQVQNAMSAMLKQGTSDPSRPIAIAIVDDHGLLLAYARMDNSRPNAQKFCIKKAYTAALMGMDSGAFADGLNKSGRSVSVFGEPDLFPIQGGVVIRKPGDNTVLGGIGVSGLPGGDLDEEVAKEGLRALNL